MDRETRSVKKTGSAVLTVHLTACCTFVSCNSVGHNAAASTFAAPESFNGCSNRGIGSQAAFAELSLGQNAFVAAVQAPHQQNEIGGPHDQSSSASRETAGAFGFLILSQSDVRPA